MSIFERFLVLQATIEFKEHQTQWTMECLLNEFVRVKRTGDEKPTDMEQVVFDGQTAAAPKKEDSVSGSSNRGPLGDPQVLQNGSYDVFKLAFW